MQAYVLQASHINNQYEFEYLKLSHLDWTTKTLPSQTLIEVNQVSGITFVVNNHLGSQGTTCDCQLVSIKYRPYGSSGDFTELYFNSANGHTHDANFEAVRPNGDRYIGLVIDKNTASAANNDSWEVKLVVHDTQGAPGNRIDCDPQIKNDPSQL